MNFNFYKLTEKYANDVLRMDASELYSCYDLDKDKKTLHEIYNSGECDFFMALDEEENLIGFAYTLFEDEIMEIFPALLIGYTGLGLAYDLINEFVNFLVEYYDYSGFYIKTLVQSVDKHTHKVFNRIGFIDIDESDEWTELRLEI